VLQEGGAQGCHELVTARHAEPGRRGSGEGRCGLNPGFSRVSHVLWHYKLSLTLGGQRGRAGACLVRPRMGGAPGRRPPRSHLRSPWQPCTLLVLSPHSARPRAPGRSVRQAETVFNQSRVLPHRAAQRRRGEKCGAGFVKTSPSPPTGPMRSPSPVRGSPLSPNREHLAMMQRMKVPTATALLGHAGCPPAEDCDTFAMSFCCAAAGLLLSQPSPI
jgi:hypothetical protein